MRKVARARSRLRFLFGPVRIRITLAALLVVALTLSIGGIALAWQLHRSLISGIQSSATAEAADVGGLYAGGSFPAALPAVRPGYAVQVVDRKGRVITATSDLSPRRAISTVHPTSGTRVLPNSATLLRGDDDPEVVLASAVATRRGPLTVYVVATVEQAEDSTRDVALVMTVALPVLLVLAGIVAWLLAGRALKPVEDIRVQVADISGRELHRRVTEPPFDDEIRRLAHTMNAMLERIQHMSDRQRRFISDASHELRSPLAGLLAQVEVAQADADHADWPQVADAVRQDGIRLHRIVDDLLLLARSDEGHLVAGHDVVDLDEIVFAEGSRIRAGGRVTVNARGVGAGRVHGDREQLRRAVRNLSENAERYASSQVGFELHAIDGWVELAVFDDGPGIPPGEREYVFERFARLDQARTRPTGGTGLGLAIVSEIVLTHGGTIVVADSTEGARIVLSLPENGATPEEG
jgi:signal transduction histidine kinase